MDPDAFFHLLLLQHGWIRQVRCGLAWGFASSLRSLLAVARTLTGSLAHKRSFQEVAKSTIGPPPNQASVSRLAGSPNS